MISVSPMLKFVKEENTFPVSKSTSPEIIKYMEEWKKVTVNCEEDNARKKEIEDVVKPLIGKIDGKTMI